MTKLLALIISVALISQPIALVHAQSRQVTIELAPICCSAPYPVYGDEQPAYEAGLPKDRARCLVNVRLNEDLEALSQSAETDSSEPTFLSGLDTAGESLGSFFSPVVEGFKSIIQKLSSDIYDHHTTAYHTFMDQLFATAFQQMTQFDTADKLEEKLATYEGQCRGENPKPECLAERALCSQEKYGQVLFNAAGQDLSNRLEAQGGEELENVLQIIQSRDEALVDEAIQVEQALDTSLAVYNQFYQTYRLHLRFKELVVRLLTIRDWTTALHTLVGCWPNKFVGVATTKCN